MDVRLLELFVAVAEEGSVHAGSRRLMIAQPAVSRGLARLELSMGTELISRSHRGVALTESGAALLVEAREILQHIDRSMEFVRAAGKTRQTLVLGLMGGVTAAADVTSDIITAFKRQRPEITVEIRDLSFIEQFDAIAAKEIDVALVRSPCPDPRLELHPLFDEPLMVCCNSSHHFAEADELAVDDILDEPLLDLSGAPKEWVDFWHLTDARGGQPRIGSGRAATLSELEFAVRFGDVITPLVRSAWRLGMGHSGLVGIPLKDAPRSESAVAHRVNDGRSVVVDFVTCAELMTHENIHKIASAELLC
ncbi:MAG: LysR family transcriptional regulator [Subtercola sp.]|nr:LysR family transcriptional regulator [Subtercola sp.]